MLGEGMKELREQKGTFSAAGMEQDQSYDKDEIAKQLAILNGQLASEIVRRRKLIRRIFIGIIVVMILSIVGYVGAFITYKSVREQNQVLSETSIECTLDGETYVYGATYNQNYQIVSAGGDAFIANHVQTEQYDDANVLFAQIEDYFIGRGGTCKIIEED